MRCLAVWLTASTGLALVGLLASLPLGRHSLSASTLRHLPLDVALVDLAAVALLGCATWLWVATTAVIVTTTRRTEVTEVPGPSRRIPPSVRRMVLAACGVALAGGLTQPSSATPYHHRHHRSPLTILSGLPLPDRAAVAREPDPPRPRADRSPRPGTTVVVEPGDSLWSLAARDLPRGSSAALVSARWHAIYAANRALIGPDPDLIVPGQRLRLPAEEPS